MEFRLVYVTAKDEGEAEKIARALLETRLAACANILPGARSLYWWEGAIQMEREAVLVAKTRAELVADLIAAVKAIHGYSVPCVVTLPILEGNPDYLDWLARETGRGANGP